jgi:uncharacterized protein with HEPN domain
MWRDDAYLLDMLIAAREVQEIASGLSREQFEASRLHQNALMRLLTVIGEAATRISDQTKATHPEVPWQPMIAFRNRLVHGYFDIDLDRIWDAIVNSVPELIRLLEPMVPPPPPEEP